MGLLLSPFGGPSPYKKVGCLLQKNLYEPLGKHPTYSISTVDFGAFLSFPHIFLLHFQPLSLQKELSIPSECSTSKRSEILNLLITQNCFHPKV